MTFQIARYRKAVTGIDDELKVFEQKYTMSSEECYLRFNSGELGDKADFFEWSGLYENFLLYRKRMAALKDEI